MKMQLQSAKTMVYGLSSMVGLLQLINLERKIIASRNEYSSSINRREKRIKPSLQRKSICNGSITIQHINCIGLWRSYKNLFSVFICKLVNIRGQAIGE